MRGNVEFWAIFRYILDFWESLQRGHKMGTLVKKGLQARRNDKNSGWELPIVK